MESTVKCLGGTRPQVTPEGDGLIQVRPTIRESFRLTEIPVLGDVVGVADADTDNHSTRCQDVNGGDLFGEQRRVTHRGD